MGHREHFKSDGCTFAPNLSFRAACVEHDYAYWIGGTEADRLKADKKLKARIESAGYPILAKVYYRFVRVFGSKYWKYGWRFNHHD